MWRLLKNKKKSKKNEIKELKLKNELAKLEIESKELENKLKCDPEDKVLASNNDNNIKKKNNIEALKVLDYVKENKRGVMPNKNHTKYSLRTVLHFEGQGFGIPFEKFIRDLFVSSGYIATKTEDQGDGGKDVIVEFKGFDVWIEAKMLDFKKGNLVEKSVIEKLHSVIEVQRKKQQKEIKGVLITTYFLSIETLMYAKKCGIEVINRKDMFELVDALCPEALDGYSWKDDRKKFKICTECEGFKINKKNGRTYQVFDGCINFVYKDKTCKKNNPLNVKYFF